MRRKKPATNVKIWGYILSLNPALLEKKKVQVQVSYSSRFLYIQTIFSQLFKNKKQLIIAFPIQNFADAQFMLSLERKAGVIWLAIKKANSLQPRSFL